MQKRHQLRYVAMGRDQLLIDILRVRGRIPDTIETRQLRQPSYQLAEPPFSAVGSFAVIGIDVLSQQGDLARSAEHEAARFGNHLHYRPRIFRAARIRDDAKAAKFIAAFLDREKSGNTPRA